jgi:hypothetical protein
MLSPALEVLDRRARRHVAGAIALGTAISFVVAFVATVPRLRVHGPSLVDDWVEIRWGPLAWHQLTHLAYDPATYDTGRFRPAFWGVWSQLQWHTLGAPGSMTGPNLWNYLKILLFLAPLAAIVVVALEACVPGIGTMRAAIFAALPAVLMLGTPQLAVDFQRFGPQEPLLFGGIAAGLLILSWVAVRLIRLEKPRWALTAAAGVAGVVLYVFGVYVKEASVCLLVLLPFLPYRAIRDAFRSARGGRRALLAVLAVVVVLPVLHMLAEIIDLSRKPQLVYGVEKPHGVGGTISRIVTVVGDQWRGIGELTGTPLWQLLIPGITILVLVTAIRARSWRRLDVALLTLAWALFVFQGLTAAIETRYFIPVVALMGIIGSLYAAHRSPMFQYWTVAVVALLVLVHMPSVANGTFGYANNDAQSLRYVDAVARLHPEKCEVYRSRMDIEARAAVPEVLALRPAPGSSCVPGYTAVLVQGTDFLKETFDTTSDKAVESACADGWKQVQKIDRAIVYGCKRLSSQPPPESRMRPESSPTAAI